MTGPQAPTLADLWERHQHLDAEAEALLRKFGMPFTREDGES